MICILLIKSHVKASEASEQTLWFYYHNETVVMRMIKLRKKKKKESRRGEGKKLKGQVFYQFRPSFFKTAKDLQNSDESHQKFMLIMKVEADNLLDSLQGGRHLTCVKTDFKYIRYFKTVSLTAVAQLLNARDSIK